MAGRKTIQVCRTSSHLCTDYFLPSGLGPFFHFLWMDQLTQIAFQKRLNFVHVSHVCNKHRENVKLSSWKVINSYFVNSFCIIEL